MQQGLEYAYRPEDGEIGEEHFLHDCVGVPDSVPERPLSSRQPARDTAFLISDSLQSPNPTTMNQVAVYYASQFPIPN